jgi:LuxR family transcriptional regulator, maltose regulon positive regulatory protein
VSERSLLAMARGDWSQAEMLAGQVSAAMRGAELFLSPHTVKSQAISIYRKLGASSRTQAVARSRELGLLDG